MRNAAAVLGCLLLVAGSQVIAQERYGSVEGQVVNSDGEALPGVTVVVSGENMMGERSAVTDQDGDFRFAVVPPGQYKVSVSLSGFQPSSRSIRYAIDGPRLIPMWQ